MKKILLAIVAAASVVFAAPRTHDGFFLNLSLGLGYYGFEYEGNAGNMSVGMEYGGMGAEFDVKLGGRVAANTLLHATILAVSNGGEVDMSAGYNGRFETVPVAADIAANLIGVGVTYYMAANMYMTATIGMSKFSLDYDDSNRKSEGATDSGFGFQLGIGREWWVSDEWGVGVSLSYVHASAEDGPYGEISSNSVSVMFSATFN